MNYFYFRSKVLDVLSLFSKPSPGVHILNGHYLSFLDEDPIIFKTLLKELQKNCILIHLDVAVNMIVSKEKIHNKVYVAFTFDDGFLECYTKIAPVLDEFNLRAGYFIIPNFVESSVEYIENMCHKTLNMPVIKNPMNWSQIKELHNAGNIIGSHTLHHQRLNTDNKLLIEDEIVGSKKKLEAKLKFDCDFFAYPYGTLSDISDYARKVALSNHKYCFTQSNHKHYFSFGNKFINRRHFEGCWPASHVNYFLKKKK